MAAAAILWDTLATLATFARTHNRHEGKNYEIKKFEKGSSVCKIKNKNIHSHTQTGMGAYINK